MKFVQDKNLMMAGQGCSRRQRGVTTVEYAITVTFLIILFLAVVLLLVNPGRGVGDSALPAGYSAVADKVGQFGIVE